MASGSEPEPGAAVPAAAPAPLAVQALAKAPPVAVAASVSTPTKEGPAHLLTGAQQHLANQSIGAGRGGSGLHGL